MRTDELRDVLHQHADVVRDQGARERVSAVHQRVGVVRRRRRAGVAGFAVVVVAAVAMGVVPHLLGQRNPDPVQSPKPARLAGYDVPPTQLLAGFTYDYVRGIQSRHGARTLRLALPESGRPQALAWASRSGDLSARVSLTVDGEPVSTSTAGGLESGELLDANSTHEVTLRIDKPGPRSLLALAVYDQTSAPPAGITNGSVTFRQNIVGDRLLGGKISAPGANGLSFDVTVPSTRLRFSDFCYGGSSATEYMLYVNGRAWTGTDCGDKQPYQDPGTTGGSPALDGRGWAGDIAPGATVHVQIKLTRSGGGATTDPNAVFGAAVYQVAPRAAVVAGWDVPELSEWDGRTWRYDPQLSIASRPGERSVTRTLPASAAPRIVAVASGHLESRVTKLYLDGTLVETQDSVPGGGGYGDEVELTPGEPHTVTFKIVHAVGTRSVLGLVVSNLVR